MRPRLVVVDGHAILFRSFFAIRGLTSPDGSPTNAIFGFVKSLSKALDRLQPQYVAVCFDSPGGTFRNVEFAQYKAQRKPTPPDLIAQEEPLKNLLSALNVSVMARPGFEADDLICALAAVADSSDIETIIVSRDKDLYQLLSETVSMYDDTADLLVTPEKLFELKGLRPEQIPDWLGLMGDSSDNIPGVAGIGEKTATALLKEYSDIEAVLKAAPQIVLNRKKIGESLIANADLARLSKRLATLEPPGDFAVDFESLRRGEPDYSLLHRIYKDLGFGSMLKEVEARLPSFPVGTGWRLVRTADELRAVVAELSQAKLFALDTETTGFRYHSDRLVGISLSWKEGIGAYLPVAEGYCNDLLGDGGSLMPIAAIREILGLVLADTAIAKVGHNLKFDMSFLAANGISVKGELHDTLIAAWLLSPEGRRLSLDALCVDMLGLRMIPIEDLIGKGSSQITMDRVPIEKVAEYSSEDADVTLRLWNILGPKLEKESLLGVFTDLEMPLVPVLSEMELNGIRLAPERLKGISESTGRELQALEKEIHELAGETFNINSTMQLARILFEKLQLPVLRVGKSLPSTDAQVLDSLRDKHPIVPMLLRYRLLQKLKSTYLDALPGYVDPVTGRIHSSFNQTGTVTGRLSSNRPNLQNIPTRKDEAAEVRSAFVPRLSCIFVSADYSQIELRVLAHFSRDPGLLKAFRENRDIHTAVAVEIFNISPSEVTPAMRTVAKAVNFGLVYGQGPFGLANVLHISRTEARKFIESYFSRFPSVQDFRESVIKDAREKRYVTTIGGRKRFIPTIVSRDAAERASGERLAVNTLIQGSAADLIKTAMINIRARIREASLPFSLLLQIHDELLYEVPEGREREATALIEKEMTTAIPLDVPLQVSVGIGHDWLELK